jgi:excisionase family DNA binding protein
MLTLPDIIRLAETHTETRAKYSKNKNGMPDRLGESTGVLDRLAVKPARAALLLDCSRTKIYDAINAGELRAVYVAGMLRIPMSEIERHLQAEEPS